MTSYCIWIGRDIDMKPHHKPFYEYRMAIKDVNEGHADTGFEGGLFNLKDKSVGCVERFQLSLSASTSLCLCLLMLANVCVASRTYA